LTAVFSVLEHVGNWACAAFAWQNGPKRLKFSEVSQVTENNCPKPERPFVVLMKVRWNKQPKGRGYMGTETKDGYMLLLQHLENVIYEEIPAVISAGTCQLGRQESLMLSAKLVEAEIPN
jgi:hypothetical protein